ncbi:MAG: 50S ribosomal protein L22 family protein [Anaerolineae bacterium]|nr:50S ribosomal protein L22 family protein [Anaerolineae bacterium]
MKAGARGRYKPRVKRSSHLTVILKEQELNLLQTPARSASAGTEEEA